jgi:hypothetical protein
VQNDESAPAAAAALAADESNPSAALLETIASSSSSSVQFNSKAPDGEEYDGMRSGATAEANKEKKKEEAGPLGPSALAVRSATSANAHGPKLRRIGLEVRLGQITRSHPFVFSWSFQWQTELWKLIFVLSNISFSLLFFSCALFSCISMV